MKPNPTDMPPLMQARVLESMAEGVSVCDENGFYTYTNAAFDRMFGYARGELAGKHVTSVNDKSEAENEAIFRNIVEQLKSEGGWAGEFENLKKDGSPLHTFARISALEVSGRVFWVTVQEDITERKRAVEKIHSLNAHLAERTGELERANERLRSANRELESFNYTVSHDLRSPLSSIHLYAELLLELHGEALSGEPRHFVESILHHSGRMEKLIDAILGLSEASQSPLRREAVRLDAMARELAEEFRRQSPGRQVDFRISEVPEVLGDEDLLRGVLENLLGNAWKFTRKKGRAVIEFGRELREGSWVYFVRDNGEGFDMSLAGSLFESFRRLHDKREFEGSGIGLATAKRIIERHGGRIWAEGVPGEGAVFFFTLG